MTLYITNVSQDRIHNMHSYPCIYDKKPEGKMYLKAEARRDMIEEWFRSNTFAYLFYLCASSLLIQGHRYQYYYSMPFDVTLYNED